MPHTVSYPINVLFVPFHIPSLVLHPLPYTINHMRCFGVSSLDLMTANKVGLSFFYMVLLEIREKMLISMALAKIKIYMHMVFQ